MIALSRWIQQRAIAKALAVRLHERLPPGQVEGRMQPQHPRRNTEMEMTTRVLRPEGEPTPLLRRQ